MGKCITIHLFCFLGVCFDNLYFQKLVHFIWFINFVGMKLSIYCFIVYLMFRESALTCFHFRQLLFVSLLEQIFIALFFSSTKITAWYFHLQYVFFYNFHFCFLLTALGTHLVLYLVYFVWRYDFTLNVLVVLWVKPKAPCISGKSNTPVIYIYTFSSYCNCLMLQLSL